METNSPTFTERPRPFGWCWSFNSKALVEKLVDESVAPDPEMFASPRRARSQQALRGPAVNRSLGHRGQFGGLIRRKDGRKPFGPARIAKRALDFLSAQIGRFATPHRTTPPRTRARPTSCRSRSAELLPRLGVRPRQWPGSEMALKEYAK